MIRELKHISCKEWLRESGLFILEKRRFQGDLIAPFPIPEEGLQESWRGTFTRAGSDSTEDNSINLKDGRFRFDIRKKFFTVRLMRHWNRLSREAADGAFLEVFKARLHGALSNLV